MNVKFLFHIRLGKVRGTQRSVVRLRIKFLLSPNETFHESFYMQHGNFLKRSNMQGSWVMENIKEFRELYDFKLSSGFLFH